MANEQSKPPTLVGAAFIYRLSLNTLKSLQQRGCNVFDAREVVKMISNTGRKPEEWREFFEDSDDSHEHWKKAKTKEEVERLRLANSKAAGEMFDRADGERIQDAWASALSLAIDERGATAPQMLAGKDEAWIADWFDEENRKMKENLSDMESGLWQEVYENYAGNEESPSDGAEGGKPKAKTKKNSK